MMGRREMSTLFKTEAEANAYLRDTRNGPAPKWPITDMRVERRAVGSYLDPANIRWVVTGDYTAWDRATC